MEIISGSSGGPEVFQPKRCDKDGCSERASLKVDMDEYTLYFCSQVHFEEWKIFYIKGVVAKPIDEPDEPWPQGAPYVGREGE